MQKLGGTMKTLLLAQILFICLQNGGYTEMPHYILFAPLYIGLAIGVLCLICVLCGAVTVDKVNK